MGSSFKSEETVREYLLGLISDETTLEELEDLLFADEEFCSEVSLAEDSLINDYVLGHLNEADVKSFQATLEGNPDRRFKLQLTQALRAKALARTAKATDDKPSFFASLAALFQQPKYVGAFAVLLIAAVSVAVYFSRKDNPDGLAELRSIYQQSRPTETRLSEFAYAPFAELRGASAPAEKNRLRRIENNLIEATEKSSNAQTHHALGVFYLTQQKYEDAIREFERALKFGAGSARIHNDLGVAHFERSKRVAPEKKLEELAQSLEEFTKATELDSNFLEALFNRSLALQEMGLRREAKESWTLYLQKDSSSPWAEEAKKHLARIESEQTLFKSDEQVLSDFLTAYRNHDQSRVQKIHDETKGLLKVVTVPLQLSRRYLLAQQRGDHAEAKESLEALTFIGNLDRAQHGDSFFFEVANFYNQVSEDKVVRLLRAKDLLAAGELLVYGKRLVKSDLPKAISEFEASRNLFTELGNVWEAAIAENWAVQLLPDVGRIAESRRRLAANITNATSRKFNLLLPPAYYWLAISDYKQNRFSDSNKNLKTALRLAETDNNAFAAHHAAEDLTLNYSYLGELESALFYASKMFSAKGTYYENPNQSLRDLGTLADLALELKLFSTALGFATEALTTAQAISPTDSRVNSNLRRVVSAVKAKGGLAAALKVANESKQIALDRGNNPENAQITAEAYLSLADVESQTKKCDEALADYDKALELYSSLPELTVSSYRIHKGKLFCFQQLDRREDFASELQTVLELSQEYRNTIREDSSRQAFFANEQDVADAATANALREGDSRRAFAFVEESRARSLLDFVESDKPIVEVERNFSAVTHPLSPAEIQARLPDEVQLLEYSVLPDKLAIWVVSKTRFDLTERAITSAELEQKIDAYQGSVVDKASATELRHAAQELYDLLIPPDLSGDKQLCLVSDKSLHQLAFASLVSPDGKYLLENHALCSAPSASVLVLATENARRKDNVTSESLLSMGNPDFDRDENPNLADLGSAETEARSIARNYGKALELLGNEATRDNFLHNFAGVEVIHFAGHFLANRRSPGNSKLLFAGGELRASELGAYKLPKAKLVVLSACETGFERYDKSEGAIGIARTFLALGAPVVVASQWQVDSEPTKDLMIAFHRNRKEKRMTSAESLRQAQLEVLSRDQTSAPFYWAAFSLFGGYANY